MRRRKKPFVARRMGFLARLFDAPPNSLNQGTVRSTGVFRNRRKAYVWAQSELAKSQFKNPEVRIYNLVDVVFPNRGSFRAARVLD